MKFFVSHAIDDLKIADALKKRIEALNPENTCVIVKDEMRPAKEWELSIKEAARDCDAAICLATAHYARRLWFVAEWSLFWFQDKLTYILTHDVAIDTLFEPMRRLEMTDLKDWRSVRSFLRELPGSEGADLEQVARDVSADVERLIELQELEQAEKHFQTMASLLADGKDNIDAEIVKKVRRGGNLDRAVETATLSGNSVKIRQFANVLLELGETGKVLPLAEATPNRAERRTIGTRVLKLLSTNPEDALLDIVFAIYCSVRAPQRRDLRDEATRLGLSLEWPPCDDEAP